LSEDVRFQPQNFASEQHKKSGTGEQVRTNWVFPRPTPSIRS